MSSPSDEVPSLMTIDSYPAIDSTKANLSGKSVFIAGASKGIGRAIAIAFAKAGASKIAIGARSDLSSLETDLQDAAAAANRKRPEVLALKLDVTSKQSIDDAALEISQKFARLDILVNNAGVVASPASVADSDPDAWWDVWTVNLRGPYLLTRAFLPLLLKGGDKQIVNVGSVGAHLILPGFSAYQPGKLALLRFTEFIDVEYKAEGVVALYIHPGNVVTDIFKGKMEMPEGLKKKFTEKPELAADSIVFLTKEKRSWLAGRYISCTWDLPEVIERKEEIINGGKLKFQMVV